MQILRLVMGVCGCSMMCVGGAAYVGSMESNGDIRAGGAKFVSIAPKESKEPESTTFIEMIWNLAYEKSGANEGKGGNSLADLRARQANQNNPMNGMSMDDMATVYEDAMKAAQAAGVPTGPSMFDGYISQRNAATDPIQRLNRGN